jgi:lysophospholipase L1-like esterase
LDSGRNRTESRRPFFTGGRKGRKSSRMLQCLTAAGILVFCLWMTGFAYGAYAILKPQQVAEWSAKDVSGNGNAASSSSDKQEIRLLALGDSLAAGFGDAAGKGFVGDLTATLQQQGYHVAQTNLGINGLTSSGLLEQMKQKEVRKLVSQANLIILSIGGNDLAHAAQFPNIDRAAVARAESGFLANLRALLSEIRSANPSAPVLLIGLYNPYGDIQEVQQQASDIVRQWVYEEDMTASRFSNTIVIQTFDLFQQNPSKFLYMDHFHPNQSGYERIAERLWEDLQTMDHWH